MNFEQLVEVWNRNQWGYRKNDIQGIVGIGGDLSLLRLREAYSTGVFPWPQENMLAWFCPFVRGVLFFDELKLNKRLMRKYRNSQYTYTMNHAFRRVIRECALAPRKDQSGTWITPQLMEAFETLYEAGDVMSFECWAEDHLVGGLYGVQVRNAQGKLILFSGESVFGSESDVSKFCLIKCIEWAREQGLTWIDIQMVTNLTEAFGGRYVTQAEFLELFIEDQKIS